MIDGAIADSVEMTAKKERSLEMWNLKRRDFISPELNVKGKC